MIIIIRRSYVYRRLFVSPVHISDIDPDVRHYKRASDFVFRRYEAGGWVTVSQTEVGYPTHTGQGGIADDVQAVYIPKLYL